MPLIFKRRSLYPAWFSRELIYLIKSKRAAHFRFKTTNLYSDYLSFAQLRSGCKAASAKCLRQYTTVMENAMSENINIFWRFVKSMKSDNSIPDIYNNDLFIDNPSDIANCFADYFESVYTTNNTQVPEVLSEHDLNMQCIDISIEIFRALETLNINLGPGADGIPPRFFNSCKYIMARILWVVFDKSLKSGVFPNDWKLCIMSHIFKNMIDPSCQITGPFVNRTLCLNCSKILLQQSSHHY